MTRILLQQVRQLLPGSPWREQVVDVIVADDRIEQIGPNLPTAGIERILPDSQAVLGPALVDLYSHSSEPGREAQETLLQLLQSARAGGFDRLNLLPDTLPPITDAATVTHLQQLSQRAIAQDPHLPQVSLWGALTHHEAMTDLSDLVAHGVVGFTDGQPIDNPLLVRRLLEYLGPYHKPVMLWPLHRGLANGGLARQGPIALQLGLPANPPESETAALAPLLEIVAAVSTPVHVMRISTARSVELIAEAQSRGVPVTASVTWMHLLGNTSTLASYDTHWRLDPPLGNDSDRAALVTGLATGTIQAIAIDHQAHSYEDKQVAFGSAPPGAIGLELALPILWAELVTSGQLTGPQLWQALSYGPSHCLGQEPPTSQILLAPSHTWVAHAAQLRAGSTNTPWLNLVIPGRVFWP
jgi:dihydroorotase